MQVGEPVAIVPVSEPPPDSELAAEMVSLTFQSGILVSHVKAKIEGPHWEKGQEGVIEDLWSRLATRLHLPVESYSKRPAVFLAKGRGAKHDVEVKVRITKSENVSGTAHLRGDFQGLSIEGDCPSGVGEHTVRARIVNPPEAIQVYRGRISWRLEVDEMSIIVSLGSTLAELYFILGIPSPPYRDEGVWVEVLRFLCGRVGVSGISDRRAATARITDYCHSGHGLQYETLHGEARYGVGHEGGTLNLMAYMMRRRFDCNCYDQAGAVQALAGAVGAQTAWLFLQPFGFINPTNLVGVGLCNSPFFKGDESKKLLGPGVKGRTSFYNHAFVLTYGPFIVDACAKPHLGTETPAEYLTDSIDHTPSLYRGTFRPGRPGDIRPKIGVVAVW